MSYFSVFSVPHSAPLRAGSLGQEKSVFVSVHQRLLSIFLMFLHTTYDIRYATYDMLHTTHDMRHTQYERSNGVFFKISLIFQTEFSIIPNKLVYSR